MFSPSARLITRNRGQIGAGQKSDRPARISGRPSGAERLLPISYDRSCHSQPRQQRSNASNASPQQSEPPRGRLVAPRDARSARTGSTASAAVQ